MKNLAVLISLLAFPAIGFCARILAFFPLAAPSHHFFYHPFLQGLAKRGHTIDYYSPFPLKVPNENITHFPIENWSKSITDHGPLFDHWKLSFLRQLYEMMSISVKLASMLCQTESMKELLNSKKTYDLYLHESMYMQQTGLIFKHKFNVPSVVLGAVDDFLTINDFSGLLVNPSYMVPAYSHHSDTMDFFERLHNAYELAGSLLLEYNHLNNVQRVVDECYTYPGWETRPPMTKLVGDQALILVNNHPSVGFQFPRPPHVKQVGGAVIQPKKPLPQDLDDFITGAKHGVIYFSLGSIFNWEKTGGNVKDTFLKIFAARKERILWKLPDEPSDKFPTNVKVSRWFPQQDILAHPNVKLFITHGGLQSIFETVTHAVPVIVIPSFADQVRNSQAVVQHGYGITLLLNNITESSLKWSLDEVLYQPKYKDTILKGSALLKDRAMDPVDEGIYWIEYVLRHGNVLQPVGARLNFVQRHCLDLLAFVLTALLIGVYFTKRILSFCFEQILFPVLGKFYKKKRE